MGFPSMPRVPRTVPWSREDWISAAMDALESMIVRTVASVALVFSV